MTNEPRSKAATNLRAVVTLSVLGFVLALGYQNCGQPVPIDDMSQASTSSSSRTGTSSNTGYDPINVSNSYTSTNTSTNTPPSTALDQTLLMNGVAGGLTPQARANVRGDVDLLYTWSCQNCTGSDIPQYSTSGTCGTVSGPVDWMASLSGQYTVAAASNRVGCTLDVTRTVRNAQGSQTKTFYFNWVGPSTTGQAAQLPEQWITMNGVLGGSSSSNRGFVAGNAQLSYAWGCTNCTSADIPTYEFGGSCGSSGGAQVDWMTGLSGQFTVAADSHREGCWLNITRTVRGAAGSNTKTFYFYWAPSPKFIITMNGVLGGSSPEKRALVRGFDDLNYAWSCEGCTSKELPTYRSTCPGAPPVEGVVDWMTGMSGSHVVPGARERIGCTLDIMWSVKGPYGENKGVSYYYWTENSSN